MYRYTFNSCCQVASYIHPEKDFFDLKKCFFAIRLKKKFIWFKEIIFKSNKFYLKYK